MNDVFISYTHVDNQSFSESEKGWIAAFHDALKAMLPQYLGKETKIWWDKRLKPVETLTNKILRELLASRILITILSPNYLDSKWCRDELTEFKTNNQVAIDYLYRILKVVKHPVPDHQCPEELQQALGYEFYRELEDGTPISIDPIPSDPDYQKYKMEICRISYHIKEIVTRIKKQTSTNPKNTPPPPSKTVYLAEVGSEFLVQRNNLRLELESRGYTVAPEMPLQAKNPGTLKKTIHHHLSRSALYVQVLEPTYSSLSEDIKQSIAEIQLDVSEDLVRKNTLSRLVWMPPGITAKDSISLRFLERINQNAASIDFIRTDLEVVKTIILDKLKQLEKEAAASAVPKNDHDADNSDGNESNQNTDSEAAGERERDGHTAGEKEKSSKEENPDLAVNPPSRPVRIYLLYDVADRQAVTPLVETLSQNPEFEILHPLFDGSESENRQIHQLRIQGCDAVLLVYNRGSEFWIEMKMEDLRKSRGHGRKAPFLATAVYRTGPDSSHKQRLTSQEIKVLRYCPDFDANPLVPFMRKVAQANMPQG